MFVSQGKTCPSKHGHATAAGFESTFCSKRKLHKCAGRIFFDNWPSLGSQGSSKTLTMSIYVQYIKPLCNLSDVYIKPLCNLSYVYIKPSCNLSCVHIEPLRNLSYVYIKPSHNLSCVHIEPLHNLSYVYIKPSRNLSYIIKSVLKT